MTLESYALSKECLHTLCFDGLWILNSDTPVHKWLTKLEIAGSAVVDGEGDLLEIMQDEEGHRLEGGLLKLRRGHLYRIGRAGVVLKYARIDGEELTSDESALEE